MDFLVGGVASMGATLFSNPLDVLKTRMQLQGELKPRGQHAIYYKTTYLAAREIMRREGVLALQKGLGAALFMHGLRNSIKLGSYQWFTNNGYICDSQNRTILYKSLTVSAFGGTLAAFLTTPLYQVTTQLQSQAVEEIAVGHQHPHRGVVNALSTVYFRHGITGLWRGSCANIVRTMVGTCAQLGSFSKMKDILRNNHEIFQGSRVLTVFVASCAGGICQTVLQTPFDLVSIRVNNQYFDANGRGILYSGMMNCFGKIIKHEGFVGLYKGFSANYMRIGRHTTCTLVFWECLKEVQVKYLQYTDNECYQSDDNAKVGSDY